MSIWSVSMYSAAFQIIYHQLLFLSLKVECTRFPTDIAWQSSNVWPYVIITINWMRWMKTINQQYVECSHWRRDWAILIYRILWAPHNLTWLIHRSINFLKQNMNYKQQVIWQPCIPLENRQRWLQHLLRRAHFSACFFKQAITNMVIKQLYTKA